MDFHVVFGIILSLYLILKIEAIDVPFQSVLALRPTTLDLKSVQNILFNTYISKISQINLTLSPKILNGQRSTQKPAYRRVFDGDEANIDLDEQNKTPIHAENELFAKLKIHKHHPKVIDVKTSTAVALGDVILPEVNTNSETYKLYPIPKLKLDERMFNEYYPTENIETSGQNSAGINTTSYYNIEHIEVETVTENSKMVTKTPALAAFNILSLNENILQDIYPSSERFKHQLDILENKLYGINLDKFRALAPLSRENGMSFVQSGLFLALALITLSLEVDPDTKKEIDQCFGADMSDLDKIIQTKRVIDSLPESTDGLKFRWSSHLVLASGREVTHQFKHGAAASLKMNIDHFQRNLTPAAKAAFLNKMIEKASGAIRDTFEEDDLTENDEAVFISTVYFRARWRSAPTLLNGTWSFRDSLDASRTVRMIRINDVMKYADLPEWDAEAIEIPYQTSGLTLLMLVPRGSSLKQLAGHVTGASLSSITDRMVTRRVAVRVPLYTLRMTLLLPNKLQAMGISRLVNASESDGSLRLSQAVQRLMFWAEAGRNAYKDDGLEWDERPEMELVVDRPYVFFVRWHNLTLMNGNFVL